MLTELEAATQATTWVKNEVEIQTCISDEEAEQLASGFVTGFLHGLRMGGQGILVVQGPTAEAFWRQNYRTALEWERTLLDPEEG